MNSDADFRFTSPDGDVATWADDSFNTVLKNDAGDYSIEFPGGVNSIPDGFSILHYTRVGPSGAPVIQFKDVAGDLEPEGLPLSDSLSSLRSSNSSSYFVDGDDLWVKLFSSYQRITFDALNLAPLAVDDYVSTAPGSPVVIDVLDNDFDPDGDQLSVVAAGVVVGDVNDGFRTPNPPSGCQYLWNAHGEFGNANNYQAMQWDAWRYRPAGINFPYIGATFAHPGNGTAQDPGGIERFAIAAFTVTEDGVYAISDSSISVNSRTLDGVHMQAHITGGAVVSLGDLYVSDGDFDGTLGYLTAGQTIYVGLGSHSTAGADGTSWDFSIVRADMPGDGTINVNPDRSVTYTPDPGFSGTDSFTYQISDGKGLRDTALVTIVVGGGNGTPVAVDDNVVIDEDTAINVAVIANDSDPDGDPLSISPVIADYRDNFSSASVPRGWHYVWNVTGPFGDEAGYNGLFWDAWRYKSAVSNFPYLTPIGVHPGDGTDESGDGLQRYAIAGYTVPVDGYYSLENSSLTLNSNSINGVNVAAHISGGGPVSNLVNISAGQTAGFDTTFGFLTAGQTIYVGVGANQNKGADGAQWGFSIVRHDNPANGAIVFNPDNTITYTPDPDFHGVDTFSYAITDGNGNFDTAVVTIDVMPVNDVPIAYNDSAIVNEDLSVVVDVLANDIDVDLNETLSVLSFSKPSNGSVIVLPDGTLRYTPDQDFNGPDQFEYTVVDAAGASDTATVTIDVRSTIDLTDVIVGDGTDQRSNVDRIVLIFDEAVDVDDAMAFMMINRDTGQAVNLAYALDPTATRLTLTFSGNQTRGNGWLRNGNFELSVDGALISSVDSGIEWDADEDGTAGGSFLFGNEETDRFFAYFGDLDGDRLISVYEMSEFRRLYRTGQYDARLDFNGNRILDGTDRLRLSSNFQRRLPF